MNTATHQGAMVSDYLVVRCCICGSKRSTERTPAGFRGVLRVGWSLRDDPLQPGYSIAFCPRHRAAGTGLAS